MVITAPIKKAFGIFLVVFFVIIELLLILVLFYNWFSGEPNAIKNAMAFLYVIGLTFFPLWWGFKLWQSASIKPRAQDAESVPLNTSIKIDVKIELAEYRKLMFKLCYTTPTFVFLNFIGIALTIFYLVAGNEDWLILFIVLFLLYLPIKIYINATSNYKTVKFLNEVVSYEFTSETITGTGTSFQTTMQWSTLYKVRELSQWFLLYTSKQQAMFIPKRAFASVDAIKIFRLYCTKVGI